MLIFLAPAWDLVWILNALWLAPLVLLLAQGHDEVRASPVDWLFFALTVLLALRAGVAGPGLRLRLHPLRSGSRGFPLLLARGQAGRPRPGTVKSLSAHPACALWREMTGAVLELRLPA